MIPPQPILTWNQVVQYAFLSEFDLLKDSCEDVWERPWAKPAAQALMDRYFKIMRAHEEIKRLNVEICHVVTHLQDEDQFLHLKAQEISLTDPLLGHQVLKYHSLCTRFKSQHMHHFEELVKTPGWSGTLDAGTSIDKTMYAVILNIGHDSHAAGQNHSLYFGSKMPSQGKHLLEDSDDDDDDQEGNEDDQLDEGLDALIAIGY
ncbi:hypothetical protein AN958_09785 [Leucoagaricus sp. SymC.cos]|nr:hypothetical protein AN958_09785 [Leucoagaricus sp. SymC.cos]